MSKVYVVNKSGHDFSSAKEYGELVFLSEGMLSKYRLNNIYRRFADILEESDSGDYLLMTGLTQLNMIAAAIMAYKHNRVNILVWSPRDRNYELTELVISNLINKEE